MKTIFSIKTLIFLITIIILSQQQCLDYDAGDTYPNLNNSYCSSIIQWPVSNQTFKIYVTNDQQALTNYQKLYQQYYLSNKVNINCLGMAKAFFCADAYPTCVKNTSIQNWQSIDVVCNWMCDLFSVRCGQDNQFYQSICLGDGKTAASTCSFENRTNLLIIFSIFVMMLLLL